MKNKHNRFRQITAAAMLLICMLLAACGRNVKPAQTEVTTADIALIETASAAADVHTEAETSEAQGKTDKETEPETEAAKTQETKAPETKPEETATAPQEAEPGHYTLADLDELKDTKNFTNSAIEHIFNGSVNSSGKGTGYHYDMIEDSDGMIIDGTRSQEDEYGIYTANVVIDGHRKSHYSSFFPDTWSPQEVVDAINAAREDALANDRKDGTTWIGYYEDIEIDMYLDSKDRIVSAFPVYIDDRH